MITRFAEAELLKLLKSFPAVGVLGPRQVGKTTLARRLMKSLNKGSLYLDLESHSDAAQLREPELFLKRHVDKCVVIDEVQRMPELFPLLRSLIDAKRKPARFILLGSASPSLLEKANEALTGRISYHELSPLNLSELVVKKHLKRHWFFGGFPPALTAVNADIAYKWLESFVRNYAERDLPILGMPATPQTIRRLLNILSHHHAQVINYSALANTLDVSMPTVKSYVEFLEGSFIVRRLNNFTSNITKRLIKAHKLYIRDSGLLHHLNNLVDEENLHRSTLLGASWEGYVIEQILELTDSKIMPFFYRTHDGSEVDLVLLKGVHVAAAIEIKYSNAPVLSRGNSIAFDDLKAKKNFVITPDSNEYEYREGILVCSLKDFLLKHIKML